MLLNLLWNEVLYGNLTFNLQMKESGIAALDIKKLKDAGLCTVESVVYSPRKELLQIKGISEAKVDKIIEAGNSLYCYLSLLFLFFFFPSFFEKLSNVIH